MDEKIPLLDLVAQYQSIKPEIDQAVQRVLDSGWFILGEEVAAFEEEASDYLNVNYGVGVASGTDALILALRALEIGEGDEVIIPAYTFFATAGAVLHVGARPVLVDINPKTYCLDVDQVQQAVTERTRAVVPVHLYGHPAEMDPLMYIAEEHHLKVIEDNAQAFGAEYKGRKTGGIADVGCLSFFPSKNLGGYGDGGMVVTDSKEVAERVRMLRVHGWKKKYYPEVLGYNSRLDALQAAVLRVKLRHVDEWNQRRREIAAVYDRALAEVPDIQAPFAADHIAHVYHLYVVRTERRDQLQKKLREKHVASGVYYPEVLHLTGPMGEFGYQVGDYPVSEQASAETLAIPIYPEIGKGNLTIIIQSIRG
jgi:dTDP-4-amino-4,6-dideoxygalactose transaminase